MPGGVVCFYQGYFLRAGEALELLFAGYGVLDVFEVFEIDEALDVIAGGVRAWDLFVVGCGALEQVVGDAGV